MKLTAIIRDESPLQIDEPCAVRRVTVDLTDEQAKALALRGSNEEYRTVFLELPPPRMCAKQQPCGCVVCTCETHDRCLGCGAKYCGTPECVFKGSGTPVFVDSAAGDLTRVQAIEAAQEIDAP